MRVYVLGSGSSGNLTVVESDGARILLDAGMNPTQATARMRALGADLFGAPGAGGVLGIVVTHHHGDHAAQIMPLARALRVPVYMHGGIDAPRARSKVEVREYRPGTSLRLGPFVLDALVVPHDAPQVALRVASASGAFGIATDLGHAPPPLADFLGACDLALVEANHCPAMLHDGPYPPRLKHRVRGPLGHLANEQTAELARRLEGRRLEKLLLGHVSRTNNSNQRALEVVSSTVRELAVEVVSNGSSKAFDVGPRARSSSAFAQLDLLL